MTVIHRDVSKRAIFVQEFRAVVETKNMFADVATKLIAKAKNLTSPYTSVTAAKAHTQACRVPLGTLTVSKDELVLDRYIGNAITDCQEELSYATFDINAMIRGDLYASVLKKLNIQAVVDFVADATVVGGTRDLSTSALVQAFLVEIAADNDASAVGLRSQIDGATVVRANKHGKPFLALGRTAYINVVSKIQSLVSQSSITGVEGKYVETPYGVTVINLGAAADNVKRMIWGTAGALTMAFRDDMIEVDMGEMTNVISYAGATDLDVTGDPVTPMLEKTWYMSAQTKGKNGIFADVQALVSTQLMA